MNQTNNTNNNTITVKLNGVYRIDSSIKGYKLTVIGSKLLFRNMFHNIKQNFRITEKNESIYTIESVSFNKIIGLNNNSDLVLLDNDRIDLYTNVYWEIIPINNN
jgi:hypothetical protein